MEPLLGGLRRRLMFILGVRVDNLDWRSALDLVHMLATARDAQLPRRLVFTNVHTVHLARRNPDFLRAVNFADLVLPDGSGLALASRAFGRPILENLNGTDFTPLVLRCAQAEGWSVYLLGARPEVVSACRERLNEAFPRLRVAGYHSGYFAEGDEHDIIEDINAVRPDILLVALGSPLQEMWVVRNLRRLRVGICLAVGGLFDFLAGTHKRAPEWMRRTGIEWLYRFLQDPLEKWKRVLVEIPVFLVLVVTRRFIPRPLQSLVFRETLPS